MGRITEGLANLTFKGVLLGVAALLVALAVMRLTTSRRNRTAGWVVENLQVVAAVVIVVFLVIRPFLFQAFYIPSSSMEPTLLGPPMVGGGEGEVTGDRLLVNKAIYRVSDPSRGDIVVFRAPPQASPDEKEYIKRTIGVPGDTVEVAPPRLLLDGKPLFTLIQEAGGGLSLPSGEEPRVSEDGRKATIPTSAGDRPLEVIVDPNPQIDVTDTGVTVNGRQSLSVPGSWLLEQPGFDTYGGDSRVQGKVFLQNDRPVLAVARGRKLEYLPGHVLVNGERLDEPYIAEPPRYSMAPRKLGPREYLMLGDNRNFSQDGHVWGNLDRERVIGRAEVLFWPIQRARVFHWWLLIAMAGLMLGYHLVHRALNGPAAD